MTGTGRTDLRSLLVPGAALILWQGASLIEHSPLFPGPLQVAVAIAENLGVIVRELGLTLMRATLGVLVAAALAIPLGIVFGRIRWLGALMEPVVDMVATLPPPAIVPLVMLFAGTGDGAKIVIVTYAASIPMLMNTYEAARSRHPMLNHVARSLRLTRLETMLLIDFPSSLPMIATGVRLATASSLLVSITSEMLLATNGIGVYLQRSQENFRIDAGLAGIAFISLVGLILNALVMKLERRWLFWHYR